MERYMVVPKSGAPVARLLTRTLEARIQARLMERKVVLRVCTSPLDLRLRRELSLARHKQSRQC